MAADSLLDESLPLVVHRRAAPSSPPTTSSLSVTVAWSEPDSALTLTLFDLSADLLLLRHVQTASSYPAFRAAQLLRVDFSQFSAHLVGLLKRVANDDTYVAELHLGAGEELRREAAEQADREAAATHAPDDELEFHTPSERIREHGVPSTALLRIVEIATFKVITHIELVMQHASNHLLVSTLAMLARGSTTSAQRQRQLESELQHTQAQLRDANVHTDRLQRLLTEAEDKMQLGERDSQKCRQLEQLLADSEQRVKELELGGDKYQTVSAECDRLRAVVENLTGNDAAKDAEIDALKQRVQTVTSQRQEACNEIEKGNKIIDTLQKELRASRARSRVKSKLIAKQEQVLAERDGKLAELQRELIRVRDRAALLHVQKEGVEDRLREALRKLEENRAVLQSDQQVIAYLNRELNDRLIDQIGGDTVQDVLGATQDVVDGSGVAT
ncbi:unnamed protein product [Agarophyton chilense]